MGRGRIVIAVIVAAAVAAGGFFLLKAMEKRRKAREPVAFAAPDLFPPDTVLFVSMHDTEVDWAEFEALWKKVEPTAAWQFASGGGGGGEAASGGPVGAVMDAWKGIADTVEKRVGRRPDAGEFFRIFGKDLAVGLVPAEAGPPLALLVTRLPDEGEVKRLREHFGATEEFKERQAPPAHGYPVFLEVLSETRTLHYGIGGGHLFVAEDAAVLDGALDNLAAVAGATAETPRPPSLAADEVFAGGVVAPWDEVRMALFLRKGSRLGEKLAEIAGGPPDDDGMNAVFERAFDVAPGAGAMALSVAGPAGERRWSASWADFSVMGRAWEQRLPADLCLAWIPRPVDPGVREAAFGKEFEELRAKRLWKEIADLAADTPRLRRLLGEAMGPESVPEDALLARLPRDLALLGEGGEALLRAMTVGGDAPLCFAQKAFRGETPTMETVVAVDLDPLTSAALTAAFDTAAREMGPDGPVSWVREKGAGAPAWHMDLGGLFGRGDPEFRDPGEEMVRSMMTGWEPGVVIGPGTLYLTFGPSMRSEIRSLVGGKSPPLSADPLWLEASAAAEPGAMDLLYERPGVILPAAMDSWRTPMRAVLDAEGTDPEARDLVKAVFAALDEVTPWTGAVRVRMTATLPDPVRRSVTVELVDPAVAGAPPVIELGPAPLGGAGWLPAETFLLMSGRWDFGPASEALVEAFMKGLPGGRDRWNEILSGGPGAEAVEKPLAALVAGVKGEIGFAMVAPGKAPPSEAPPSAAAVAERLFSTVAYATYGDAGAAFTEAADLMEKLHGMLREQFDTGDFDEAVAAFEAGEGPPALAFLLDAEDSPAGPSRTVRVLAAVEPGAPPLVWRVGVLRRGDTLFFTCSPRKPSEVAGLAGGEGTLAARMKGSLPGEMVPAEAAALVVLREDGVSDVLGPLLDLVVPVGPGLSTMGMEEPDPDRMKAHEEGWRLGIDLLKDAMRTGRWQVVVRTREEDRWVTVRRRSAER